LRGDQQNRFADGLDTGLNFKRNTNSEFDDLLQKIAFIREIEKLSASARTDL
jgi:hypothetical protein